MRVIFMGSPQFAVPTLEALVEAGQEVLAVYCQPPRPAGRGKGERPTAVHERALELGLDVRHPTSLKNEAEQAAFRSLDADVAIVAAYGLILPRPILDAPRMGCVNVHASLLPRWRGAAPVQRAILAGDEVTGVTIMQMEEGLDTGPMLLTREAQVDGKNAGQLTEELSFIGARALMAWLVEPGAHPPQPQPETGATYAAKIGKSEARIDWRKGADEIERQIRAFNPMPGAWFEAGGERIKLLEAAAGDHAAGAPGEVLDDCLSIACGDGCVRALKVQRAGKGPMTAADLLRGFAIPKGTILP